jgi:hypothetical protein
MRIGLTLLLVMLIASPAFARIWPKSIPDYRQISGAGLDEAQAEYLVALVAKHQGYRVDKDGSVIERLTEGGKGEKDSFPGYFYLRIGFGSASQDVTYYPQYYFVSKTTGDVWTARIPDALKCQRVSFAALQKIQNQIMSRTGGSFAAEKAQRDALGCAGR